jgi:hypothetical protein
MNNHLDVAAALAGGRISTRAMSAVDDAGHPVAQPRRAGATAEPRHPRPRTALRACAAFWPDCAFAQPSLLLRLRRRRTERPASSEIRGGIRRLRALRQDGLGAMMAGKGLILLVTVAALSAAGVTSAQARGRGSAAAAVGIGALIIGGMAAAAAAQSQAQARPAGPPPRRVVKRRAPKAPQAAQIKPASPRAETASASDPFATATPSRPATVPVRQ